MVTKALSKVYYKGLPSKPPLSPAPSNDQTGPEAYSVLKGFRELGDHPLASVWDHGLAERLCRGLNKMCVNWASIDAVRIVEVGGSSGPAIVWIGVEFGAPSFKEGNIVAQNCHTFIISSHYHIHDYCLEIRVSHIVGQAGNRFFDPVPLSNPTFTARDPYTETLGISISAKDRPWAEGTGGFDLSAGGNYKVIYLVTARHVVLPLAGDDNKPYKRKDDSKARRRCCSRHLWLRRELTAIDYDVKGQEYTVTDAQGRVKSVEGQIDPYSIGERQAAGQDLENGGSALEGLSALSHETSARWGEKEKRVFGELVWAPPVVPPTEPGQFTLDLPVVKIDAGNLDADNHYGNTVNIGNKYTRQGLVDKACLSPTSPTFRFPANHLVTLRDRVPETAHARHRQRAVLYRLQKWRQDGYYDRQGEQRFLYTRNYFAGQYQESRKWPVIPTYRHSSASVPTNKYSGVFSAEGDSGSCVADVFQRIGNILTGGYGASKSSDITYVTPISFIMKVLHGFKDFQYAHLNPVLD